MSDGTPSAAPAPAAPSEGRDNSQDRKAGFKPMHGTKAEGASGDLSGPREAAAALARQRGKAAQSKPIETVRYQTPDGKKAPENETIDLNRGADDLIARRKGQAEAVQKNADLVDTVAVDLTRADAGVAPEPTQPQIEQSDIHNEPATPGLDPEVERAMKLPQVRAAIEEKIGHATKAEGEFRQATETVYHAAVASIAAVFPELTGIPPQQIEARLQQMRQTDPVRFNQAVAALQRAAKFENVLNQNQQRQAQVQQQRMEVEAKRHDQAFEKSIGPQTPQQKQAVAAEMISFASEWGIDRKSLVQAMQTNPILRTAAFQRVMWEAAQHRIMKREGAKYRDKLDRTAPVIQKPGNGGSRVSPTNVNLNALSNKLTKTGSARDAAALLTAMRRGGR